MKFESVDNDHEHPCHRQLNILIGWSGQGDVWWLVTPHEGDMSGSNLHPCQPVESIDDEHEPPHVTVRQFDNLIGYDWGCDEQWLETQTGVEGDRWFDVDPGGRPYKKTWWGPGRDVCSQELERLYEHTLWVIDCQKVKIWKFINVVRVMLAPHSPHSQRQATFPDSPHVFNAPLLPVTLD